MEKAIHIISLIKVFYILNEEQIINDEYMDKKITFNHSDISYSTSMNRENPPLDTDVPVEFEK